MRFNRMLTKHLGREFFIPKGATKVADKHSDAVAYAYTTAVTGKPGAAIFFGKQTKPVSHYTYRDVARRDAAIAQAFESRRKSLAFKTEQRAKRKAWVPDYKVGEILYTSWGYEQTQCEWFEVTEIKGKHVILREIAQERTQTGPDSGRCVPLPGQYLKPRYEGDNAGKAIRRLAQEHGVKIDDVRTAHRTRPKEIGGVKVYDSHYWSSYH